MEPLNKEARSKAVKKFLGTYLLSLMLPLGAMFFLLRTPDGYLKEENQALQQKIAAYERLLLEMDSLSRQVGYLYDLDQKMDGMPQADMQRASLAAQAKNYESVMLRLIEDGKTAMPTELSKTEQRHYTNTLGAFNTLAAYRIKIGSLQETLASAGDAVKRIDELKSEITDLKRQLEMKDLQLAMKQNAGGGGGGGGAKPAADNSAALQASLKQCEDEKVSMKTEMSERIELGKADGLRSAALNKKLFERTERGKLRDAAWEIAKAIHDRTRDEEVKRDAKALMDQISVIK
jgi:hypothetical protein